MNQSADKSMYWSEDTCQQHQLHVLYSTSRLYGPRRSNGHAYN